MTPDHIEAAVARFLELRELDQEEDPADFVEAYLAAAGPTCPNPATDRDREELRNAIVAAIEVDRLLPGPMDVPVRIGPYHVLRELGRGGMGVVYEVERAGTRMALKLHHSSVRPSGGGADRLKREMQNLAGLDHPNIVRVVDTGAHLGAPYIVIDLIEGLPLDQLVSSLDRDTALRLVEKLTRAVDHAHRNGVIHRDLKPSNVIVRPDGEPVLFDFGLSQNEDLSALTLTGEILGTPRYMAPEQVREGSADARSDVYALGLILFELLTRRPARGSRSREELIRQAATGGVIPPRRTDSSIDRRLERIVRQALAPRPDDRYQTAAALADDLTRFLRGERVLARPPRTPIPSTPLARGVTAACVLLALTLLSLAAVGWSRHRREEAKSRRIEADAHFRVALARYLDGDTLTALERVRSALVSDPEEPHARALRAHLEPGATGTLSARERAIVRALGAFASRDSASLRSALRSADAEEGVIGRALFSLLPSKPPDGPQFESQVRRSMEELPGSLRLPLRLAQYYRLQGDNRRAREALRSAARIDSLSPDFWAETAALGLARRDLEGGLVAVRRARSQGDSSSVELMLLEATLLGNAGRGGPARALLRRVISVRPDLAEAWYQLGYAHDVDHQLLPAIDAYERALSLDPARSHAWSMLANLRSGASRNTCHGCDTAYAAHPEVYHLAEAKRCLIHALRADRGRTEWLARIALDVALRFPNRGPVIALADSLAADNPTSPGGLRLIELARRLRLNSAGQ